MSSDYSNDPAVNNLRNYLRIRSVHPNVNYDECIKYLKDQAKELGLPVQVFEPLPRKPVLVITWEGLEPTLPSILLNSHMDVVPVFEESWKHPPFEAQLEDGVIYARGVQDMKSVAVQYIEAVRRLKVKGIRLKRTVHLSFMPGVDLLIVVPLKKPDDHISLAHDEEIGGSTGMGVFVKTTDFKNLNVGFSLDEGLASPTEDYIVYKGERTIYHVNISCAGKSGHGSQLLPDNAGEKIRYIIDKFMEMRQQSKQKLAEDTSLTIGDVTSVNLTMLSGGIQSNVIPEKLSATFDVRLAPTFKPEDFETMLNAWCKEAGPNVTIEYIQRDPYVAPTVLDENNLYWQAFKNAADKLNIKLIPRIFPGGTDSRFIRALSVPALGFSPMSCTVPGLHEHEENLHADVFLKGIHLYEEIVPAVANA